MAITWTKDEIILACALVKAHGWKGLDDADPAVIDLSNVLNAAPLHPVADRDPKFRNPNGVARKTWDIATQHPDYEGVPTRGNRLDGVVLREFLAEPARMDAVAASIRSTILSGELMSIPDEEVVGEEFEADEGRLLIAKHIRRERNQKLRKAKLARVTAEGKPIACEVCSFDFAKSYGSLGQGYIEVHHVLPLHASGPTRTRLEDLALLCSNCHRMIHRSRPWLTPPELAARIVSA